MKVRMVEKKDFKEWLLLRKCLWPENSLAELETEMQQFYTELDANPTFLAEDKERKICGFVEVSLRKGIPGCKTGDIGYIEGWYVKPEYRNMGIGKKLISTAEKWASSKGCREMASYSSERFPLSNVAHQSLGYRSGKTASQFSKAISRTK